MNKTKTVKKKKDEGTVRNLALKEFIYPDNVFGSMKEGDEQYFADYGGWPYGGFVVRKKDGKFTLSFLSRK